MPRNFSVPSELMPNSETTLLAFLLVTYKYGGQQIVKQLQEIGKLNDGTPLHYAAGLYIYNYRGLRVVDHGGSDAG